ncbi:MAG: Hint domain-containing protein [Candidatus Paceibacterota bacterium]
MKEELAMQKALKIVQKKSKHMRVLSYVLLSALVALVGGRALTDNSDGHVVNSGQDQKGGGAVPTAFADEVVSSEGGGGGEGGSGNATGGPGCCFPGDVKIRTEDGTRAISELREGDTVISFDEEVGAFSTSRIAKVLKHGKETNDVHDFGKDPLLKVSYMKGDDPSELIITSNHPVYDPATKEYKEIREFSVGDRIRTSTGEAEITKINELDAGKHFGDDPDPIVYNLTLENGPRTYVADGVVVHNKQHGDGGDCL